MPDTKKAPVPANEVTAQSFEAVKVEEPRLTADEQKAADARTEEEDKRTRLAAKAEAARFVRVRAED